MVATPEDPRAHAGVLRFPRNTHDLTSTTQCPACFTPLTSTLCTFCGLDLSHPAAAELAELSSKTAEDLDARAGIVGRMRLDTQRTAQQASDAAAASARAAAPAAAAPSSVAAAPVAAAASSAPDTAPWVTPSPTTHSPQPAAASAPATSAPAATPAQPPAQPRRHLGAQVILLLVGVSLLSVGAIFFLVYAFITFGLVWRSVIIASVTIAAFVGASLLQRRRLTASAEAVAALAVVFVYLDAFAVRANDLFGLGDSEPLGYWGVVLVLSAAGFAVWHRFTGLRLPNFVSAAAFGTGLALLGAGLTNHLTVSVQLQVALTALAASGLAHPLLTVRPRHDDPPKAPLAERLIVLALSGVGVLAALTTSLSSTSPLFSLAILGVIALAIALLAVRSSVPVAAAAAFAGAGSVAITGAVAADAFLSGSAPYFFLVAPLVAAALALLAEQVRLRLTTSPLRQLSTVAMYSAAAVAAFATFPSLLLAGGGVAGPFLSGWWSAVPTEAIARPDEHALGVVAVAAVVALVTGVWAATGLLARRRLIVLGAVAATLVLAAPLLTALWAVTAAWLVLAGSGVAALIAVRHRTVSSGARLIVGAGTALSATLGYAAAWTSEGLWWIGSLATIGIAVAAWFTHSHVAVRLGSVALATVVALVAAAGAGWQLHDVAGLTYPQVDAAQFSGLLAGILVVASALLMRILPDLRLTFWISLTTGAIIGGSLWLAKLGAPAEIAGRDLVLPYDGAGLAMSLLLLAGVALSALRRTPSSLSATERSIATTLFAPLLAWALQSLVALLGLPTPSPTLALLFAAILALAAGLAAEHSIDGPPRWAFDTGAAVVGITALALALPSDGGWGWLALLVAAIGILIAAISPDGLFGSASPRKHLGWVALAMATSALWWRLVDGRVEQIEAFVLPPALVILAIAALVWRTERQRARLVVDARTTRAPQLLAFGALLLALLPLAVDAIGGPLGRAIVIAVITGLLTVAGVYAGRRRDSAVAEFADAALLAGLVSFLTLAFARAFIAITTTPSTLTAETWLLPVVVVLVAVSLGLALARGEGAAARANLAPWPLVAAIAGIVVLEAIGTTDTRLGAARALVTIVVLSAVYAVSAIRRRLPTTAIVGWVALGGAVVLAITGITQNLVEPFETATAPIAMALLAVGALRLRDPETRSWPALGPGLAVLLVPSLVATFIEPELWRLVTLGVVGVAVIAAGALLRLGAPLILGAGVVLIHAIRTFAPQIVALYQLTQWWVWAVIGGALLLFLGLTVEKRVRDLKAIGGRLKDLR